MSTTSEEERQAAIAARADVMRRETVVDRPWDGRVCSGCSEPIAEGQKHYRVGAADSGSETSWHPHCFRCTTCKVVLERENFKERDGKLYCSTHFGEQFCPRCAGCNEPILDEEFSQALDKSWHPQCFACTFCKKPLDSEYVCDGNQRPYCDTNCFVSQVKANKASKAKEEEDSSGNVVDQVEIKTKTTVRKKQKKKILVKGTSKSNGLTPKSTDNSESTESEAPKSPKSHSKDKHKDKDHRSPTKDKNKMVKLRVKSPRVEKPQSKAETPGARFLRGLQASEDKYSVTSVNNLDGLEGKRECDACREHSATVRLNIATTVLKVNALVCDKCADTLKKKSNITQSPSVKAKKAKRLELKAARKSRHSTGGDKDRKKDKNRTFDASELAEMKAKLDQGLSTSTKIRKVRDDSGRPSSTAGTPTGKKKASAGTLGRARKGRKSMGANYVISEDDFVTDLDQMALAAIRKKQAASVNNASTADQDDNSKRTPLSKKERSLFEQCRNLWNDTSPKAALQRFEAKEMKSPRTLAKFIAAELDQLDTVSVGEYLGRDDPLWQSTLKHFLIDLNLKGVDVLTALRKCISQFRLPGEGQVINRIMQTFSIAYCKANKNTWKDPDHVHTLCMLVLTLNTATHNPNEERKILEDDWVYYCEELQESEKICTEEYLRDIWRDIQDREIRMPMEGMFPDMVRRGYLDHYEVAGFGKKWKNRWIILSDNCLYLFETPEDEDPRTIVPLTGVSARSLLPNATPGGTKVERFAFELVATDSEANLVYTEKHAKDSKLKQGKESKLLFSASTGKERDLWLADIQGNQISTPTKVPFAALSEEE